MLNNKILKALHHVRMYSPKVQYVVFFSPHVWNYYTEEMFAPDLYDSGVDFMILEDAAYSLEPEHFPFIYKFKG